MCSIINDTTIKARKEHKCSALDLIYEEGLREVMSWLDIDTKKQLAKLVANKGMIKIGEDYRNYTFEDGGTIYRIKESLIAAQICSQYDLYPDC